MAMDLVDVGIVIGLCVLRFGVPILIIWLLGRKSPEAAPSHAN